MNKVWFLAGLLALLPACAPTPLPAAPTAPVPSGTPGLYELQVQVSPQGVGQASLRRVDGAGLRAQGLSTAGDPLRLGAQALTTQTFTTTREGADVRHISTTFAATNVSGTSLQHLTLLPVVLTDTDGDPGNNATAPTVAGTPFRGVRLFDGSDASAQAAAIRPVQGQQVDVRTGESSENPAATPFIRLLNVTDLNAAPPAGLSMTVQNQGWLAAETLAPGATVPVTFAVDLPIDRSNPRGQPFSFSLMFTAAQDSTASEVGRPADPAVVSGAVSSWTAGGAFGLSEQYLDPQVGDWVTRASAPVSAGGQVHLPLQGPGQLEPLLGPDCTVQGEQSAGNVNVATAQLAFQTAQGDTLAPLRELAPDGSAVRRLYADAPLRLKGAATCAGFPEVSYSYDLSLQRGWNLITERTASAGATILRSTRSLPAGTRTRLRLAQQGPVVQVKTPAWGADVTVRAGGAVAVPFELLQKGPLSGPVTVATDVPGITVTPGTLTFPALTAQAIGAQALSTTLTFSAAAGMAAYQDGMRLTFSQGDNLWATPSCFSM
ncbi:hypothetical protein [Deinococcus arcticus]|uniref:ZU5 domain-containing protein n=1 Tax=Deinococcus arcticus TaxID=2136176 RepID=A0A2T3W817_9DEIO|nr:hypothetical protein [Deinococcus arcticus]PTA68060.1 hypothetical protein C8263_10110 [Deinococcus arcticus]